jgi:hypothetical protein
MHNRTRIGTPGDAKARMRLKAMLTKLTLAAAVIGTVALLTPASAAPIAPQSAIPEVAGTEGNLLLQVHRRHRHWHHRHCRRVCHGHLRWSRWRGHYVCHGHWHRRCHWH